MKLRFTTLVLLIGLASATGSFGQTVTGVTGSGQTVSSSIGKPPPWQPDLIKMVVPEYTLAQRQRRNQGTGLYRATIDLKSGAVKAAVVVKSSGHQPLDRSAVVALKQWRFKPGSWKQIDFPFSFISVANRREALERAERLRQREKR